MIENGVKVTIVDDDNEEPCAQEAPSVIRLDEDAADLPVQEETDLPRRFQDILLRPRPSFGELSGPSSLGRYLLSYLDTKALLNCRMTDKARAKGIPSPVKRVDTPIHDVRIEFQTTDGLVSLTTDNLEPFKGRGLLASEHNPATLLSCLSQNFGLGLHGERFFPPINAAYIKAGPFSNKHVRLSPRQSREDLLGAVRQGDDSETKEFLTVLVAGPIPTALTSSIFEAERKLQLQYGFRKQLYDDDLTTAENIRRHQSVIRKAIRTNNQAHAARSEPRKWPQQFAGSFFCDDVCDPAIDLTSDV